MLGGVRRLRVASAESPLLGLLGLVSPLAVVVGGAIASDAAQDILHQDWDWLDEHRGQLQLALVAVMLLLGVVLYRSPRTRPIGAGILLGVVAVLLVVAVMMVFWLAMVALWVGGCAAQGC